jgi:hypothetical protein
MSSLKAKIIGLVALAIAFLAVAADVKTVDPGAWSTLRDIPGVLVDTDVPLLVPICVVGITLLTAVLMLRRMGPMLTKARMSEEARPTVTNQDLLSGLSSLEDAMDEAASPKRQSTSDPKVLDQGFTSKSSPLRLEKQDFDG